MREKMKVLSFALLIAAGMSLALPALAATKTVNLTADNKFSPASLSVSVGDTVEFKWGGGFHDVVFADKSSGAPTDATGVLYSRTFDSAGTYSYVCSVHEALGMTGAITVAAASGDTTTTTAVEATTSTSVEATTTTIAATTTTTIAAAASTDTIATVVAAASISATTTEESLQMPHTGPEDSPLMVLGGALVAIGMAGLLIVRRLRA